MVQQSVTLTINQNLKAFNRPTAGKCLLRHSSKVQFKADKKQKAKEYT